MRQTEMELAEHPAISCDGARHRAVYPRQSAVLPFMSRGATDGSFLRARGMAVYGVPIFMRDSCENREHGNDERIQLSNLESGVELLWQMVLESAGEN